MPDLAHVAQIHMEPPSDLVSEMEVELKYGQKGTRLHIHLTQPVIAALLTRDVVAQELRDLGTALLRIADQPSAIVGNHLDHN